MDDELCPAFKKPRFEEPPDFHYEKSNETNREFDVLDEVKGDDTGSEGEGEGEGSENDSSASDLGDEDVEQLLDDQLPDELNKKKENQFEERYKTVLEEKGHNYFEVLPEGWLQVTHSSGMPVYLHKQSRVCSVSRPYFLGQGSVRKHEIPLSAIPCLNYRRALAKEDQTRAEIEQALNNESVDVEMETSTGQGLPLPLPNARIETVKENLQAQSLKADEMTLYCKRLFHFKQIRVMRFKSWTARRKFTKNKKHIKNLQRPTLPDGTKLITLPALPAIEGTNTNGRKKEWIMNPNGKSYVCILHEYVQHALKKQPMYEFKELENAALPYSATVSINGLKYGTGLGTSKKQAKSEAARETLEVLIPEMRDKITGDKNNGISKKDAYKDMSVFDEIRIEDPRVAEYSAKTTEPSPHSILIACLQRNFGSGDIKIDYQVNALRHKKNEFTMTVGKHKAVVVCKNKRDGKQKASQAILQILHPHIKTWGSLLRLYGNHSVKSFKEKKQEEQQITVLQSKAAENQPNHAILDKLQLEMTKLSEIRKAIKPIGKFVPFEGDELPTTSSSNLNIVEF